jgi:hypothetical protein
MAGRAERDLGAYREDVAACAEADISAIYVGVRTHLDPATVPIDGSDLHCTVRR